MFALFVAYHDRRRLLIVPGVVSVTVATQLHPTGFELLVPTAILIGACLVEDRARLSRTLRPLGVGIAGAALLESPFIIWQFRNGWPLLDATGHLASDPAMLDVSALHFATSAAVGNGYPLLALVGDSWGPARWIELLLMLGGLGILGANAATTTKSVARIEALALAGWLAVPILAQLRHSVPVFPHYFIVLFPAPFLLMGMAVSAILNFGKASRYDGLAPRPLAIGTKAVAALFVAVPVGLGIVSFAEYVRALDGGRARPEFGVSLAEQRQLLAAGTDGGRLAPISFGSHDNLAPALAYLGDGQVRTFDDRIGLLLPSGARPSAVVESDAPSAAGLLLRRLNPNPFEALRLPWGGSELVFRLPGGGAAPAAGFQLLGAAFDDGITIESYRILGETGQNIVVDLVLGLRGLSPPLTPMAFNHLVDPRGETVSQFDGPAYPSLGWLDGDACLSEFTLPPPVAPGPYRLELGLYDYPSLQRHHVTGTSLNPQHDAVILAVP
jgi:hypothetical protein